MRMSMSAQKQGDRGDPFHHLPLTLSFATSSIHLHILASSSHVSPELISPPETHPTMPVGVNSRISLNFPVSPGMSKTHLAYIAVLKRGSYSGRCT